MLVANALKQGYKVLDTDTLIFGWLMTKDFASKLEQLSKRDGNPAPWNATGEGRLQWSILQRAALAIATSLSEYGVTIVTNLLAEDEKPKNVYNNTYTFFRDPKEMVRLSNERRIAKGQEPHRDMLKTYQSWADGWKKHNGDYDHSQMLDQQYLTEVFDLEPIVKDLKEAEPIVWKYAYSLLDKFSFRDLVSTQGRASL